MRVIGKIVIVLLLAAVVYGCVQERRLPAKGQVVYCPHCQHDLYKREEGTSRTRFRAQDYSPVRFDIEIPRLNDPFKCPLCGEQIVETNDEGYVTKVFYRDMLSDGKWR